MDGGWDKNGNSLPWDVIDYEGDDADIRNLKKSHAFADQWQELNVKLRKRNWRCDFLSRFPVWTVTSHAREILDPLLGDTVEFLSLRCDPKIDLYVLHPLRHIALAEGAETTPDDASSNITVIRRYSFNPRDLDGIHVFHVSQRPGSPAGRAGSPCTGYLVSDDFVRTIEENALRGVVFEKVFSL